MAAEPSADAQHAAEALALGALAVAAGGKLAEDIPLRDTFAEAEALNPPEVMAFIHELFRRAGMTYEPGAAS